MSYSKNVCANELAVSSRRAQWAGPVFSGGACAARPVPILDYRHRFKPPKYIDEQYVDILSSKSEREIFCNCKVESFPTFKKAVVANRPVFKDPSWELRQEPKMKAARAQNPDNEPQLRSTHRARKKVFDIAALNDFRYFVTLTLSPTAINRENEFEVARKLKVFLAHKVERSGWSYLLVPEYHKDGKGIHLHGLVSGNIRLNDSGKLTKDKKRIYNMPEWSYGFSTCIELSGDCRHTAKYMTKYISKNMQKIFGNFYYAGGNIRRKPSTLYTNVDYDELDAPPYDVPEIGVSFKYVEFDGVGE